MTLRERLADESGLAGTVLIIVIAWALGAVFMLTNTLIDARQIDDRVSTITGEVGPIDDDLDDIPVAGQIAETAAAIDAAAKPLSGQLDQVIGAAGGIDGSVESILASAEGINASARSINGTVDSIDERLSGVLTAAESIACGGVGRAVDTFDEQVALCGVRGVPGINNRADILIDLVRRIEADTSNILSAVVENVHPHANSIDCAVSGGSCDGHDGEGL